MKQKSLLKTLLLLCALVVGGSAWAAEVTDELTQSWTGVSGTNYSDWSGKTSNSDAVYAGQSAGGNSSIQLRSNNNNSGVVTTASGGKVKKITVTWNSNTSNGRTLNVYGKNTAYSAATDLYGDNSGTLLGTIVYGTSNELTVTDDYTYIGFRSASGAMYLDEVDIVWETVSGGSGTSVSINDDNLTNTDVYTSTVAGSLIATVKDNNDNVISGATVSWSSNDEDVATINANGVVTLVAAGTVTFTANYAGVTNQYQASSATYEMTVTSSAPYVQPTEFDINLNNSLFGTDYNGSVSGITDDDPISGTKDNVTVTYAGSGNHYVNDSQIRFYPNNKLTFAAPSGYVIEEITFTSAGTWAATISANEGTYDSGNKQWTGSVATVIFTGSGSSRCDMSKATIKLGEPSTDPEISADATLSLAFDATSGEIGYRIINPVDGASLTATSEADWISDFNVAADKVTFITTANTGAERTATVTLTYTYGDNETVTLEVEVTQAAPVLDYATLPFSFNSGKAAIENTSGLTHSGLGADYSAENTKLRFDNSGDELVLELNEAPGTISFDIKGNGSGNDPQSGVFKVQVSANGVDYSDIASYSSLGDTETITLYNTNASVRYIKWIYVTKTVGNVALGNIKVIAGFQKAVTEVGWATWNAPCAVSFPEGVSAYLVTENSDATKVSLIEVSDVPANTPVLLEASAGTYEMSRVESSSTSTNGNLLRVSTGTNSGTMYVLAKVDEVVGFYMWDPNKTLPEGKIYLEMPGSTARPFIALSGEETGISDMNRETITNNRYFDLQGRRVLAPTKGMYIVNGKKVVVK